VAEQVSNTVAAYDALAPNANADKHKPLNCGADSVSWLQYASSDAIPSVAIPES
jgi:hypothetical protein